MSPAQPFPRHCRAPSTTESLSQHPRDDAPASLLAELPGPCLPQPCRPASGQLLLPASCPVARRWVPVATTWHPLHSHSTLTEISFLGHRLCGALPCAAVRWGCRWGIKATLLTGLSVQLVGLGMLFAWQSSWDKTQAICYVTAAQMM